MPEQTASMIECTEVQHASATTSHVNIEFDGTKRTHMIQVWRDRIHSSSEVHVERKVYFSVPKFLRHRKLQPKITL
jgi:hypothetical protein